MELTIMTFGGRFGYYFKKARKARAMPPAKAGAPVTRATAGPPGNSFSSAPGAQLRLLMYSAVKRHKVAMELCGAEGTGGLTAGVHFGMPPRLDPRRQARLCRCGRERGCRRVSPGPEAVLIRALRFPWEAG
jgi:hypothetical protein